MEHSFVVEQPVSRIEDAYQRASDTLENCDDSMNGCVGELLQCRDDIWCPLDSPSSRALQELSLLLILNVDREELKLVFISPLRVKGRLLV